MFKNGFYMGLHLGSHVGLQVCLQASEKVGMGGRGRGGRGKGRVKIHYFSIHLLKNKFKPFRNHLIL